MRKLREREYPRGTGIPDLYADLISRTDTKAIYERSDFCFEVFNIRILEAEDILGKSYPKREVYPGNEDFGLSAWCYGSRVLAMQKYDRI